MAPELVIDNPKQMVIIHTRDGIVYYNKEFLKFCGLYGIQPEACRNYRARTKGKTERPFYYIQEHLLRGLEVESFQEFEEKLKDFRDEYNQRPHSKLKEPPEERFQREKDHLRPLAWSNRPFCIPGNPKKSATMATSPVPETLIPCPCAFV